MKKGFNFTIKRENGQEITLWIHQPTKKQAQSFYAQFCAKHRDQIIEIREVEVY